MTDHNSFCMHICTNKALSSSSSTLDFVTSRSVSEGEHPSFPAIPSSVPAMSLHKAAGFTVDTKASTSTIVKTPENVSIQYLLFMICAYMFP